MAHFIDGQWVEGQGQDLVSRDPATGDILYQGTEAGAEQVGAAVSAAREAFQAWGQQSLDMRIKIAEAYRDILIERKDALAELIAREAGKVMWDARGEAAAMAGKVDISVRAYHERTPTRMNDAEPISAGLTHRPHGVMAVFGPYNFPGHLPNGHIVPALIAGNTVVFKPSEQTPAVAEFMVRAWQDAGLPPGVLNLVQGARAAGEALVANGDIDGVLFTGSVRVGQILARQLADRPWVIQAMEMGGNNPLIVTEVADNNSAALLTIQSAFITSGQRCTCARRLIVPEGGAGDAFLEKLAVMMDRIRVGDWRGGEDVFMGPLVSAQSARAVQGAYYALITAGGKALRPLEALENGPAFLRPALVDVTGVQTADEEIFGPVLQVRRVKDLAAAVVEANNTRYGLASGLISDSREDFDYFFPRARAGIVNWNQQTTGASSAAPFGGIGLSGNHRPSAYYAADYCAYPVASMVAAGGRAHLASVPAGIDFEGS